MNLKAWVSTLFVCAALNVAAVPPAVAHNHARAHVHVGGGLSHAPFTRTALVLYRDIVYDDSSPDRHATSLDVYTAEPAPRGAPVIVYVHGGGYAAGDKAWSKDLDPKPEYFTNQLGYVFVSINYRLLPAGRYPVNVQDTANALAWIHRHVGELGGDPERIVLMGHSAGAGLVAQVATDERFLRNAGKDLSLLKGAIPIDGSAFDLTRSTSRRGELVARYGDNWRRASPIAHVDRDKGIPPFLFLHVDDGSDGGGHSSEQANVLAVALRDAGVRADVVPLTHVEHFGANERIGEPGDVTTAAVERFLESLWSGHARLTAR
jgi:arylformamidase